MDFKKECEEENRKRYSACIPDDLDLPFFTYGFFKPHQIAHSQIEGHMLKGKTKEAFVKGYIKHVNGMPVLFLNRSSEYDVLGNMIYFKEGHKQDAYEKIGYSKHMRIYKWKEIEIGDDTANALISSTPRKVNLFHLGEKDMKYIIDKHDEEVRKIHNYDWRLDPLYDETISYIHFLINSSISDERNDYSELIKTQMLYTSLWTMIDRFLTFKYGETKRGNVEALAKEDYFKEILNDVLSRNHKPYHYARVFSAQDLYYHELGSPKESALFYYTLRNNVVHSGKMFVSDNEMLFDALTDLLEIFEGVLQVVRSE